MKAKSIPVTTSEVLASQGAVRQKRIEAVKSELANFEKHSACKEATKQEVQECKLRGIHPLPCQVVWVLKPLTTSSAALSPRAVITASISVIPEKCRSTTSCVAPS